MTDKIYIAVIAKDTSGDSLFTTLAIASINRSDFTRLLDISCTVTSNKFTKASLDLIDFTYIKIMELSEEQTEQVEQIEARIRNEKEIYFTCLKDEEFVALKSMPFVSTLDELTDIYPNYFKGTTGVADADGTCVYTREITFDQLERAFN